MDLGLGNLATVKAYVLPSQITDTQWDSVLASIALGVAKRFEAYCNRKFGRVVNDISRFPGNRSHYYLERYPFEAITSMTMRAVASDPWTDVLSAIVQQDERIGLIDMYVILADEMSLIQVTYTGGYWYETQEPLLANGTANEAYPTAQPGGQFNPTSTPSGSWGLLDPTYGAVALQQAWLAQILHEFELKDRLLPSGLAGDGQKSHTNWRLDQAVLLPEVENAIAQFRRYQMV